ncbi:MAG: creatininase family protein [Pseudomonadota bacterium]|nr:creatininase family protein [Pseudomonadota bacterium]
MKVGLRVADATWPEVAQRRSAGAVAVLPVGAACKAHGRHLPMNTDQIQAEALSNFLAEALDVVIWPTVTYGHYPAFTAYPGSCSISADGFSGLVTDILSGISASGPGAVAVINTGISTIAPLRRAVAACPGKHVALVNIYEGERYTAMAGQIAEQSLGGHADEMETSIMLALCPRRVEMGQARAWDEHRIEGRLSRLDPGDPNYSPDGVYGNPALATPDKGHRLLEAIREDVLTVIRGLLKT